MTATVPVGAEEEPARRELDRLGLIRPEATAAILRLRDQRRGIASAGEVGKAATINRRGLILNTAAAVAEAVRLIITLGSMGAVVCLAVQEAAPVVRMLQAETVGLGKATPSAAAERAVRRAAIRVPRVLPAPALASVTVAAVAAEIPRVAQVVAPRLAAVVVVALARDLARALMADLAK